MKRFNVTPKRATPSLPLLRLMGFIYISLISNFVYAAFEDVVSNTSSAIVVIESNTGQGSGVLLDRSGVIVTNLHVLEDADELWVKLHTGERFDDVSVIDFDEVKDIALIKIKGFDLPIADLGNSNAVRSGQSVFAIGAPRGLEQTVSRGIVSSVRNMKTGFKSIQTDAAISPGSSGGGLFNTNGELIGILAAYRENGQNLNFAVPINYVRGMMGQAVAYTEEEFLALNVQTPAFGEDMATVVGRQKIEAWLREFEEEFADVEVRQGKDDLYGVAIGELVVLMRLLDDLLIIGLDIGDEREYTKSELKRLLQLSRELDYAYLVLTDDQLTANVEIHVPGSTYSAFHVSLFSVLVAAVKVEEEGLLMPAEESYPAELGGDSEPDVYTERKPSILESSSLDGLRSAEPGGHGVTFNYRAFHWDMVKQEEAIFFSSKRGVDRFAKVFVEIINTEETDTKDLLAFLADAYIEASKDQYSNLELYDQGRRQVQSRASVWFQYSITISENKSFWYTTLVLDGDRLLTVHTFSEENWEPLEGVTQELLESVRF